MKTKGSVDKVNYRKTRSDKGKKRERYAGKKTLPRKKVNGQYRTYVSKRKRGDPIKVEFHTVELMSHQGFMNFSSKVRRHMHRYVYGKQRVCFTLDPESISTKEKISELCCQNLWEGTWHLKLRSHAKNTHHNSPKSFAVVRITQHKEGLKCKVTPNYRRRSLKRLFFWKDS